MGKPHAGSGLCHSTVLAEGWFFHEKWLLLEEEGSTAFLLAAPPLLCGVWGVNTLSVRLLRRHLPSCLLVPVSSVTCMFESSVFAHGLRSAGDVGRVLPFSCLRCS